MFPCSVRSCNDDLAFSQLQEKDRFNSPAMKVEPSVGFEPTTY